MAPIDRGRARACRRARPCADANARWTWRVIVVRAGSPATRRAPRGARRGRRARRAARRARDPRRSRAARRPGAPSSCSSGRRRMFAIQSGTSGSGSAIASATNGASVTPFRSAFSAVTSTAIGIVVARVHGIEPEADRRDREHARAAAEVEQRAPAGSDGEQLERGARRSVTAGAERLARDRSRRAGMPAGASSQGGPTQSRPPITRPWWNSRQRSAQSLVDRLDGPRAELGRQLVGGLGVRDDLQPPVAARAPRTRRAGARSPVHAASRPPRRPASLGRASARTVTRRRGGSRRRDAPRSCRCARPRTRGSAPSAPSGRASGASARAR